MPQPQNMNVAEPISISCVSALLGALVRVAASSSYRRTSVSGSGVTAISITVRAGVDFAPFGGSGVVTFCCILSMTTPMRAAVPSAVLAAISAFCCHGIAKDGGALGPFDSVDPLHGEGTHGDEDLYHGCDVDNTDLNDGDGVCDEESTDDDGGGGDTDGADCAAFGSTEATTKSKEQITARIHNDITNLEADDFQLHYQ